MNLSQDKEKVFCHKCQEWIDLLMATYYDEDEVRCLNCNEVLGYMWDLDES